MSKPREFDIYQEKFGNFDAFPRGELSKKHRSTPIHVVEYSALEQARAEIKLRTRMAEALVSNAEKERDAALKEVESLIDQLQWSHKNEAQYKTALKKIFEEIKELRSQLGGNK